MQRRLCLILLMVVTASCVRADAPPAGWVSPLGRDHPLTGRIWLTQDGRFATADEAVAKLAVARFVLLGEKHDNSDHHRLQAWLVQRLVAQQRPAIALEAIDEGQAPALEAHLAFRPADADGIGKALDWRDSGWPDWQHYAPVVRPVLAQGGPILATIPAQGVVRAASRNGIAALPPARVRALGLETDLPAPDRAVLARAIDEGHCRMLPPEALGSMVTVQRIKDAAMARALIDGTSLAGRDMAILIAGNGHVRRDHGVPWHLGRLAEDGVTVAVGMVEVQSGATEPESYAASFGVDRLPFDIVWFTARVDDDDPCARHADQFRRARERRTNPEAR